MGLNIFSIMSDDDLSLAKNFCNEDFYYEVKESFEHMVENIDSFVRYRPHVAEFAIASVTLPTWRTYNCLITSADALTLRAGDLANRFLLVPDRDESLAFVEYAAEIAGLEFTQTVAQVGFLNQAVRFINTVADLRCYQYCREKCLKEHPDDRPAYKLCLRLCIENERC